MTVGRLRISTHAAHGCRVVTASVRDYWTALSIHVGGPPYYVSLTWGSL